MEETNHLQHELSHRNPRQRVQQPFREPPERPAVCYDSAITERNQCKSKDPTIAALWAF